MLELQTYQRKRKFQLIIWRTIWHVNYKFSPNYLASFYSVINFLLLKFFLINITSLCILSIISNTINFNGHKLMFVPVQKIPLVDYIYRLKSLCTVCTNQSRFDKKFVWQRIRERIYKNLVISIIYNGSLF